MGDFKPLLALEDGMTMIEHTVNSVLNSNVEKCVVVLGYQGEKIKENFEKSSTNYDHKELIFINNYLFQTSDMLYSIALGLQKLLDSAEVTAAFIVPGDMPRISTETFLTLQQKFERQDAKGKVIFPRYEGRAKHPPLIARECFQTVIDYDQDGGLRKALEIFKDETVYIDIDDLGCCLDADTKTDFLEKVYPYSRKDKNITHNNE